MNEGCGVGKEASAWQQAWCSAAAGGHAEEKWVSRLLALGTALTIPYSCQEELILSSDAF